MTDVTIFSRVADGQERSLRALIRRQDRNAFAGLGTHFARLVVLDPAPPRMDEVLLLFTSRFDGDLDDYLARFARKPAAVTIWSHCVLDGEAKTRLDAASLTSYLRDPSHQVRNLYPVSAFPAGITVDEINEALELREEFAAFVRRAQSERRDAVWLAHAFRQLPKIREMLSKA
jgi:hypothetical protein